MAHKEFFDKNGTRITEFAVLKIYHFTGERRKKHYMYKWVRKDEQGNMRALHLTDAESSVWLIAMCNGEGVISSAEVVQDVVDL